MWTLRLDHEQEPVGEREQWFRQSGFEHWIGLPDALQNAGFGQPVTVDTEWMGVSGYHLWMTKKYEKYRQPGTIKVPFFLQPERRFVGHAWYQKAVVIGSNAPRDKDLILSLERPHWASTVWWDGRWIGTSDSLGVPHVFHLGKNPAPGEHNLVIKVNNTLLFPVGSRAHSVSDETQGAWNGVIGELRLDWREPVYLGRIKVSTDAQSRSAQVEVGIENTTGALTEAELSIAGKRQSVQLRAGVTRVEGRVEFGDNAELWSEFHPVLHDLKISLASRFGTASESLKIGIRNWSTEGKKLMLNGHQTFMRGTLDCCIFPKTGYPPMDKAAWLEHLGTMKASGINHVRFHSWCPPRAAFEAGDELGMYLMPEIHIWGDPSNERFGGWVEQEGKRILDTYGNHPSFCFFTHGNEPWRPGPNVAFLADLTKTLKAYDSRMLHTASANTIQSPYDDFTCRAFPRGPGGWKGKSYRYEGQNPFIQHEPGPWCAYRVGSGKLLVCMADLLEQQKTNPAAGQLLSSILGYMNSPVLAPDTEVRLSDLSDALRYASNPSTMLNLGASVKEVSHAWTHSQGLAIDGDDATGWGGKFTGVDDFIIIDLGTEQTLQGVLLTHANLKEVEICFGADLRDLQRVPLLDPGRNPAPSVLLDEGLMNTSREIPFEGEAKGRFLKINTNSVHGTSIKLNEVDVIFVIM